jgi:hypothetical protein
MGGSTSSETEKCMTPMDDVQVLYGVIEKQSGIPFIWPRSIETDDEAKEHGFAEKLGYEIVMRTLDADEASQRLDEVIKERHGL